MEQVYKEIGITRQAIWKWKYRQNVKVDKTAVILEQIIKWRKNHPKLGSRQLYHTMRNGGVKLGIGINQFEKIVKENGFMAGKARTKKPQGSDGKGKRDYPNLTNGLELTGINQLIVLDLTYIWVDNQWCYIFTIKDVYSQWMVLKPSRSKEAKYALQCLEEFVKLRGKNEVKGCIHHSDNGSEYEWTPYKKALFDYGFLISRSRTCKENGSVEQSHHVSKNMYIEAWGVKTFEKLDKACKEFEFRNNHQRAIKQLGNISPLEFERSIKNIPHELRKKKTMHDFNGQKNV